MLTKEDKLGAVVWARGSSLDGAAARVIRGGSWYAQKESAKAVYRSSAQPKLRRQCARLPSGDVESGCHTLKPS